MRTLTTTIGLVFCCFLMAAQDRGTIDGTVFDRIGHKVANARVEAKDMASGTSFTGASDEQGVYVLSVPAGTYEVSVVVDGHTNIQPPGTIRA